MKLKYILIAAILAFSACSEEFLDVTPKGVLDESLLNSPGSIEALCVSAYSALAGPEGSSNAFQSPTTNWIYGEVRGGSSYKGGGGITDIFEYHAMEVFNGVYVTNTLVNRKWIRLYTSVQRATTAIRRLNTIDESIFPLKETRLGEMRFLRAHYYFELNRLFNRIPYFDETVEIDEYINVSNVEFTRDQILEMIAEEFAAAALVLPEVQTERGRATKYAALAYQAKVTLYRAYKQNPDNTLSSIDQGLLNEVLALCEQVKAGGFGLLSDFQHLAEVEHEDGIETVFAVMHSINDGTTNGRINWSNLLNSPRGPAYSGDGFYQPSQNLVNSYKTDGNGLPLFDTYYNGDIMTADDGFNYNVDPRLDYTVGRPGIRYKNYTVSAYANNWSREPATYGYYGTKKFLVSPESPYMVLGWPWGGSALDWQIIRYADVLLWEAEALIELGRQNEAVSIINRIRERAQNSAYVLRWNNTSPTDYAANYLIGLYEPGVNCDWTQEYARQALYFERKLELAQEGDRFFDLVRWGTAEEYLNNEYFANEKDIRTYLQSANFTKGRDEYFPIPQPQIGYSGGLYQQNPGY